MLRPFIAFGDGLDKLFCFGEINFVVSMVSARCRLYLLLLLLHYIPWYELFLN